MASDLVTVLADGTFEDQVVETLAFLSRTLPEASRNEFISKLQAKALEAEPIAAEGEEAPKPADPVKKQEVVKELVSQITSLGEGTDRELEGIFNLVTSLINTNFAAADQESTRNELLVQVASALVKDSSTEKNLVRYRILSNIFNTVASTCSVRLEIFSALLTLASANDDLDYLSSALNQLPQWLAEWQVSDEAKSACLDKVAKAFEAAEKEHDHGLKAYQFLVLHLRFISNTLSSDNAKTIAEQTVASALRLTKMFELEDLMQIKAVLDLNGTPIFELLKIFVGGSAQDYKNWVSNSDNAKELERLGLTDAELLQKIRLLDLAGLCAQSVSKDVAYSEIAKVLSISEDEVEIWVINVIRAGLVSGKLSQVKQSFRVYQSAHRAFGKEQWKTLETRLVQWQQSINNIIDTIANTRGGRLNGVAEPVTSAALEAEATSA